MAGRGVLFEVADRRCPGAGRRLGALRRTRGARPAAGARPPAHGRGYPRAPRVRGGDGAGRSPRPRRTRASRLQHRALGRACRRRPSPVGGRVGYGARPAALGHRGHAGRVHRAGRVPGVEPGLPAGVRDDPGRHPPAHGSPRPLSGVRARAAHRRPVRPPSPAAGGGLRPAGGVLGAAGGRRVRCRRLSRAVPAGGPLDVRPGVSAGPPAHAARRRFGAHGDGRGGARGGVAGGQPASGAGAQPVAGRFSPAHVPGAYVAPAFFGPYCVLVLAALGGSAATRPRRRALASARAPGCSWPVSWRRWPRTSRASSRSVFPGTVTLAAANWASVLGSVSALAVPCLTMYAATSLRVLDVRTTIRVSARRLLTRGGLALLAVGTAGRPRRAGLRAAPTGR